MQPVALFASLAVHGVLVGVLLVLPQPSQREPAREFMTIVDRDTPEVKREEPKAEEPAAKPPEKPEPAKIRPSRPKVVRPRVVPSPKSPEPVPPDTPQEGLPDVETPAAPDTGAQTFGLTMEGATAAPGTGVAVPKGQTLETSPQVKRVGKGAPDGARPGFKTDYERGEMAPLSVIRTMPRVLRRVEPEYPSAVRELGVEGEVVLSLTIDADGKVSRVRLLEGLHPTLDSEAIAAAKQMQFSPAETNGVAVSTVITYRFSFVLD